MKHQGSAMLTTPPYLKRMSRHLLNE